MKDEGGQGCLIFILHPSSFILPPPPRIHMKMQVLRILIVAQVRQNTGGSFLTNDKRCNGLYNLKQLIEQFLLRSQKRINMRLWNDDDVSFPERAGVVIREHVV